MVNNPYKSTMLLCFKSVSVLVILLSVVLQCCEGFDGGLVEGNVRLNRFDSPFTILRHIFVDKDATLTIDPGVEMRFSPGIMMAVNGTLRAIGTESLPIRMTAASGGTSPPQWPEDIRLVDERSVHLGRLQLLHKGKWRGVCANFQNWTEEDTTVACRQLGFQRGNFSFISYATNDSAFMLYHKPLCSGEEDSINHCPGADTIQIGSRICLHQQTIHLFCEGLAPHNPALQNWWGLEFYNSTLRSSIEGTIVLNESASDLQWVEVLHAGVDDLGKPAPAVRASPTGPHLLHVNVLHSALDGLNYTDIKSATIIHNSHFHNNRGHGANVESHFGRLSVTDSRFNGNYGNGLKTKFVDGKYPIFDERDTFCKAPDIGGYQRFPQTFVGIPDKQLSGPCGKRFRTQPDYIITLNVLEMETEEDAEGWLDVYDGPDKNSVRIGHFPITNGTLPQGVSSTWGNLYVQFTWMMLPPNCPLLWDCIKFTIMLDAGPETVPEIYVNSTEAANNTQHGIFVENVRNKAYINCSQMTHNGYGAGLRVFGGAGDVHVNASSMTYNQDNGVNITYAGGWRIVNMTEVNHNLGNGLNVTINETRVDNKTRYARHHRTDVFLSHFEYNDGMGVRVGNFCERSFISINDSFFVRNQKAGVELESCFKIVPDANITNFTVAYNLFDSNYGHAIRIVPLLNAEGIISNNTFVNHPRHVLLLDNSDDFLRSREYTKMKVDYEVRGNDFHDNKGFYVAHIRLTENSEKQRLDFKYNILTDNEIEGGFPTLNARTKANAVVIVSSSNVNCSRNHIQNPLSKFEVATHLLDPSIKMESTAQYWGTISYAEIITRIFDHYSRYSVGVISYHPVLTSNWLYAPANTLTWTQLPKEIDFERPGSVLGGQLSNVKTLDRDRKYYVDRDINIVPEGELRLQSGTTLEFVNSVGMFVQGRLTSLVDSASDPQIVLTLRNDTTYINSSSVRLADGPNELEGRLEVRPDVGEPWGTVCNVGWTITDASVVCQQLGMVIHPDDWQVFHNLPGHSGQPIWRSYVHCTDFDLDLMQCEADGEADHSCTHEQDVYVRCKPPTWAGMRLLATARGSKLAHMDIQQAGLLDPTALLYAPAIAIDYNVHTLEHLHVHDNVATGIEILHNDAYSNAKISHSTVANNFGNGISSRGSFFAVAFCTLRGNSRAGFEYNPHTTGDEALSMRRGIHDAWTIQGMDGKSELIVNEGYQFVVTEEEQPSSPVMYEVEFYGNSAYRLVVDILDWNPDTDQELVTIYDGSKDSIQAGTHRWVIEDDLVDFPIQSSGSRLTFRLHVKTIASGRFTFVVRSKPNSWGYPFPTLELTNTTLLHNDHGAILRHYNQPSDQYLNLFFRHRWEYITLYGVLFESNNLEAMHVPSITKYNELYMPTFEELQIPSKIAEINYEIRSCHFTKNGGGILGEHNHVEFSNNVWIWEVSSNLFDYNTDGGFDIELPKVNLMYQELYNHSVDVNDTIFEYNDNFEFRIDGFYCNSSIYRNRFYHNLCKVGCLKISGTEKDIEIHDNELTENTGRYILELHMTSHTPYTRWVDGTIMYNDFKRNKRPPGLAMSATSSPASYALGMKGLQNITINRNLFHNPELEYEMIGGQSSSALENYLDITANWWGTFDQPTLRDRIFDFDDWNNYAIAEYYPFLLGDRYDAPLATGGKWTPELDPSQPLGGRIESPLTLYKRSTPYIVSRDLTVMPEASLLVEPGVEMQFYPNVGILVLGSMTLRGKEDDRIRLGPMERAASLNVNVNMSSPSRKKRHESRLHGDDTGNENLIQVRLNGGEKPNEGFVEFYNETERRWAIICDDSFNDRTAEVACRSMGREVSNVYVTRTRYYDMFVLGYPKMHEQVIEWYWRNTFICDGTEANMDECRYKQNYHLYRCMEERQYVFLRCGERNLAPEFDFWGNLRFSTPEYEQGAITPGYSVMENVDIYGAGILHEEKTAAIQSVHRVPTTKNLRITNCAWNGYDYIAPRDEFEVGFNELHNNNGYAVGGLVLNGDSNYDNTLSSFIPLEENRVPYNTHGLVRMCTAEKLILVQDRLLLYFKYRFDTIDCIKIIRSKEPRKQVALRFLQVNLYNDTFYKNAIEMYDGEYFDPNMMIGEITPNSTQEAKASKYATSRYDSYAYWDTMGIRITASPAHGDFGFIAEVVTLPLSPGWKPELGPGFRQHIHDTAITGNQRGAFYFQNAGELNPSVIIERCRIQDGGIGIYNITSPPVMSMHVQNSRLMTIANNYIVNNAGGIFVNTSTSSLATAVYANITNNVLVYNTHGEMMHLEGHHYQSFNVRNNYIAHNNLDYNNVLATFGVALNFSSTTVLNNTGMTILNASVPEQVAITQRFYGNGIYDNIAIGANHTTVFLHSPKSSFTQNYLLNRLNFYEMVTYNRTKYIDGLYPDVDAAMNWWGFGTPAFISGRIWDRRDDDDLFRVNYEPFHETNTSLLQGRCYPGWRLYEKRCYLYMGGVTPYHEAMAMCKRDRGTLARAYDTGPTRKLERFLGEVVQSGQENYDVHWNTWVYSDWQQEGMCTVLRDYKIAHIDCNTLLPYVCEKSPYVEPEMNWWPVIIALSVTGSVLLIVAILICCAICKRQQRKQQNFERRNSLHRSLRASKMSIAASNANLSHDVVLQKKRRPPLGGSTIDGSFLNLTGVTMEDTSTDHHRTERPKLDFHRPATPASTLDYSSTKHLDNSSYFDSDLGPKHRPRYDTLDSDDDPTPLPSQHPAFEYPYKKPRPTLHKPSTTSSQMDRPYQQQQPHHQQYPMQLENEIAYLPTRPTVYRNQAYNEEQSLDRSRLQSSDSDSVAQGPRHYPQASSRTSIERPRPRETDM